MPTDYQADLQKFFEKFSEAIIDFKGLTMQTTEIRSENARLRAELVSAIAAGEAGMEQTEHLAREVALLKAELAAAEAKFKSELAAREAPPAEPELICPVCKRPVAMARIEDGCWVVIHKAIVDCNRRFPYGDTREAALEGFRWVPAEPELAACPFCGGEAALYSGVFHNGKYTHRACCPNCRLQIDGNDKEVIVKVWNRRTLSPDLHRLGELCHALKARLLSASENIEFRALVKKLFPEVPQ